MFGYRFIDQAVPAMCRSRAAARLRAIQECSPDTRAPPSDLAQNALKWVIGTVSAPMFLRERIVGERLLHRRFHKLGGLGQAQAPQLLDHSGSLLARCRNILTGVDRLEHSRDLPHLGRRHMTENVAVPMQDPALPIRP